MSTTAPRALAANARTETWSLLVPRIATSPGALAGLIVLLVGFAVGVFVAPRGPERPPYEAAEAAIADRLTAFALRDAARWREVEGDLVLPWDDARGHMAIVIDDVGRELALHERLQALRFRLTFSVLPGSRYAMGAQLRLVEDTRRPRDVMLHLPMEPSRVEAMTEGDEAHETFLRRDDDAETLARKTRAALDAVPHAIGVNNHMGSALTTDPRAMSAIMPVLRERGVFFLDSRTTAQTVAATAARDAGLPTLERAVFLDHDPSEAAIEAALREAAARSRDQPIVVIAHPSGAVVDVLERELPRLHDEGIGVYSVSELLARTSAASAGHDGSARR